MVRDTDYGTGQGPVSRQHFKQKTKWFLRRLCPKQSVIVIQIYCRNHCIVGQHWCWMCHPKSNFCKYQCSPAQYNNTIMYAEPRFTLESGSGQIQTVPISASGQWPGIGDGIAVGGNTGIGRPWVRKLGINKNYFPQPQIYLGTH